MFHDRSRAFLEVIVYAAYAVVACMNLIEEPRDLYCDSCTWEGHDAAPVDDRRILALKPGEVVPHAACPMNLCPGLCYETPPRG